MQTAINQSIDILRSFGFNIPNPIIIILVFIFLVGALVTYLDKIYNFLIYLKNKTVNSMRKSNEEEQFVAFRSVFIEHLLYEVKKLNRDSDWNDFHYTGLEAEVEVDESLDLSTGGAGRHSLQLSLVRYIISNSIKILRLSPTISIKKDLVHAIIKSKNKSFLIVGDPGSGKTVSLRYLFVKLAESSCNAKGKNVTIPIYLNLKHLDIEPDNLSNDTIHEWILRQLRAGQDRTIHTFLDKNFEKMLANGNYFFLFDSFDEIPAVIDAHEDQDIVQVYANALNGFLYSQHKCKGLVSSRPYREPKTFIGQKMLIRPLSEKRIKKAIYKYLPQDSSLAEQIWQELLRNRNDLFSISCNPFYLSLLVRYAKNNKKLPERRYDLFENFIQERAKTDKDRLIAFDLNPSELIHRAGVLAFAMTSTDHVGLEADIAHIPEIISKFDEIPGQKKEDADSLIDALCYSKLGRVSSEGVGKPRMFSFVHRRFHEYFCARYITQNLHKAPIQHLAADDRWRETLVLLCEVLPINNLSSIFDIIRLNLSKGINADRSSEEIKKSIEALRFVLDGFRCRINEIPSDIRASCSEFIKSQMHGSNILNKKRALEAVCIADEESARLILESTLKSESEWLREIAIRSCRILESINPQIAISIRQHFYNRYLDLSIRHDYAFYSILFSHPKSLSIFRSFLRLLYSIACIQIILYIFIMIYSLFNGAQLILNSILVISLFYVGGALLGEMDLKLSYYTEYISKGNKYFDELIFKRIKQPSKDIKDSWRPNNTAFGGFWGTVLVGFMYGLMITMMVDKYVNSNLMMHFSAIVMLCFILNVTIIYLIKEFPTSTREWIQLPINLLANLVKKFTIKMVIYIFSLALGIISVFYILINYIVPSIKWAFIIFKTNNFNIPSTYSSIGIEATIYVLFLLSVIIICGLCIVGILIIIAYGIMLESYKVLMDLVVFSSLSLLANRRPKTTIEAIDLLSSLKSDKGRVQYLRALFKWLPNGKEPERFLEEANRYSPSVKDQMGKLAEIWEDSLPRNN